MEKIPNQDGEMWTDRHDSYIALSDINIVLHTICLIHVKCSNNFATKLRIKVKLSIPFLSFRCEATKPLCCLFLFFITV